MGYTTSEKRAALSALTQQDLTFSRNVLGGRNISATYAQLRELVLTGFYYEPDAVFALIDISADYWASRVSAMRSQGAALREDVAFLLSKDREFTRLDLLRRAKATVGRARVTAAVQGKVGPRPLERYRRLVDQALTDMSRQTVQAGAALTGGGRQVVKARKTVQKTLGTDFSALVANHASMRAGLDNLAGAFAAYEGADALAALSLTQLERLDDMVGDVVDDLESLSADAARESMRDYFINLLGGQAIARRLEERISPSQPRLTATSEFRITSYAPITPPSITGDVCSPWPLEQGSTDTLSIDFSGTTVAVDLTPITQNEVGIEAAEVVGSTFEPFRIVASDTDPVALLTQKITTGSNYTVNGTNLYLIVDGTPWTIAFGSDQKAIQVASTINAVGGITVTATPQNSGGQDWVEIAYSNGSPPDRYDQRFMSVVSGINNAANLAPWDLDGPSGLVAGTRSFGADQRNTLKLYANDSTTVSTITLTAGAWPNYERTAAQVAADITTAGGAAFEALSTDDRITIRSELKGEGSLIRVATDGLLGGVATVSHRTLLELGFVEYLESRQQDILMGQVLNVLNNTSAFTAQGLASSTRQTLYEARDAEVTGASALRFNVGTSDPSGSWDLSQLKAAIHTGGNQGTYTVASVSYSQPYLTLNLNRALRDQTAANRFSVSVISERLTVASLDTTPGAYLQVQSPAQTAHTTLGLATTLLKGTTTTVLVERNDAVRGWLPADLRPYSVRAGDIIVDSTGAEVATVTGAARRDEGLLTVTSVDADFSLTSGFTIKSGAYAAYKTFKLSLDAFRRSFTDYEDDRLKVIADRLLPQLRIKEPSRDQVVAIGSQLDDYDDKLEALESALTDYSVTRPAVVTKAMRAMQEHGHDRARQLLLEGDLEAFLSLTSSGASKSQYFMQQLNDVATSDINEPTYVDDEGEAELERFMVGYEEDDNPAFEVEDEEVWPDSPFTNRPFEPATVDTDALGYTPTARGAKR